MIDFYPEIRLVHIWAVAASGSLFALRGLALNLGAAWPRAAPLRFLSYTIDTVLLTAALMLMTVVQQYPFVDAWLTVKVLLLVVYIGLGIYAFRTRRSQGVRWTAWLAALLVFGFIVSVALAHDPWGLLSPLAGPAGS
ncbi:MAG TPA: SirB2 family protein [Kiloniellaceae bacterium]